MKLVIDIGNTNIVAAVKQSEDWLHTWRFPTSTEIISSEYEVRLRQQLLESEVRISDIELVAMSSVVPALTDRILEVCKKLFALDVMLVNPSVIRKLALGDVIRPDEIGSDLVANAVAGYDRYKRSCIIVDFGTALTFTSVREDGKVAGVAIAPGVRTAMKSLSSNTAKLPEIPLEIPESFIGTNTVEAMQAGIMQGYAGLVSHMINETKKELGSVEKVIATGGLSFIFKPLQESIDEIVPSLTLDGILEIHRRVFL